MQADAGAADVITYAIGDIHGRLDLLADLLDRIENDAAARHASAKIVFTGDYLDRGMESHGVVERLIAGPRRAEDRFVCLLGNHDDIFIRAVAGERDLPAWAMELHKHTFVSYGVDGERSPESEAALRRHADFLATLPLTHDDGTHFFVHAGIRPGVALDRQARYDLLWIRGEFLTYTPPLPRRIVHGHTIVGDRPVVTHNRISIDTGAYRSGILTAAVFEAGPLRFLQAQGDPDRAAIVREVLLSAFIDDRTVSAEAEAAFEDFVEGRIGITEFEKRTRLAAL